MTDLSTTYLGLKLKNPVVVGSCGLTKSVDSIKTLAENKAGAVVLKSLFEEQIEAELATNMESYHTDYPDAFDYVREYTRGNAVSDYLKLIQDAKAAVDIPIIASINCVSDNEWTSFAASVEKAGADALELNVSLLPSDPNRHGEDNEKHYFAIMDKVKSSTNLPVALKMSHYSAGLANLVKRLGWSEKIAGFVLFNRYYRPDINIDRLEITGADILSSPAEITEPLRWIGLLSSRVAKDFAASTGVHDSAGLIKMLLAGASVVQVVSTLYKHGPEQVAALVNGLEEWMEAKSFTSLAEFRGRLSYANVENPAPLERIQFMKQFGGIV